MMAGVDLALNGSDDSRMLTIYLKNIGTDKTPSYAHHLIVRDTIGSDIPDNLSDWR